VSTTGKKILIADDNRQIRMLVCAALYSSGYELIEAEDGEAAIETAVTQLPDLLLLDVTMPKLDGFEVLHFLRKRPETVDMRIVMLTTSATQTDVAHGMAEGADDYITKPFEPATLRETVQRQLA
jgi:DNA-binding response OmpR family regulator